MRKFKQGFFRPKNREKYSGNPDQIVFRSGWERKIMQRFDERDDILAWASEEIAVPYLSPIDHKRHRYFPDFLIKARQKDGTEKIFMLEVKPAAQTTAPKPRKRKTKKYIAEARTYLINNSKFTAAEEFCRKRGWVFKIITEKDLSL